VPDARFAHCLNAQIAHLMMNTVRDETRPGDPLNYPLNWQRDGAYIIAALSRAGLGEAAHILVKPFAELDFFGGFGSEADAPGLALWAIHETARALPAAAREAYEAEMWPHVYRKAQLLNAMRDTKIPFRAPPSGPIVPEHRAKPDLDLVCEPSINGLINGRMDWHSPLLYINAVAFGGLRCAADFALRGGQNALADNWRELARDIQSAWFDALETSHADNQRSAICGLWPTNIAAPLRLTYLKLLEKRDQSTLDAAGAPLEWPLWTYFHFGEAHQWLLLGKAERAWTTLEWFWNHQSSPGLWTWWEGNREENSFGDWESVRGWANPHCVTPHCWTAAEVLALQLDMLCHLNFDEEQTLIIGAGVRGEWLDAPLRVANFPLDGGFVDWQWHPAARFLEVWLSDLAPDLSVRAAAIFGDARLQVHRSND